MEFFKLDSAYLPDNTVINYDSLVWTERYRASGDFKLVVKDEMSILTTLPTGTLVSHTDTFEVMIVENQELVRDDKKHPIITISGRSFETFAENRTTAGSENPLYSGTPEVGQVETVASASSSTIVATLLKGRMEPGTASVANAIPNLRIVTTMRAPDGAMAQVIKRGDLYSRVIELLNLCDGGLMNRRPNGAQTTLDLVVHDGVDLTGTVTFYALTDDLKDCKYFWSIKDYKNYAAIATHITARVYRTRDLGVDVNGLARRVMYVEADDLKLAYSPATSTDVVASRAQAALDDQIQLYLMEATVTETAKPKFKFNYDVGDLVLVLGEFEAAEAMRVTEHILTKDDKGIRGFPSLSAL